MISDLLRRLDRRLFGENLSIYQRTVTDVLAGDWESLLDVGCGPSSPLQQACTRIPYTVGVDAHADSVRQSRAAGIHSHYECMDILGIADRFGAASFDVVAALDVVEHLERADGERLLELLENVARRLVVIFTPNGYLKQGNLDENPWQVHRCGWSVADFRARGYDVLGMNGWKPLRGEMWQPRVRPPGFGHRLSASTQPLVTHHPQWAFQLLALRHQNREAWSPRHLR